MDVCGAKHNLEVIAVDRLEILRLKEEERIEVRLNVKEPSRQAIVEEQVLAQVPGIRAFLTHDSRIAFGSHVLVCFADRKLFFTGLLCVG